MQLFYRILANSALASIVNYTVWFAVTFFVFLQTRSVFATSLISGVYLVISAFSGFWFGSLVDHHKKKDVLIWSSVFSFVAYVVGFALYVTAAPEAFVHVESLRLWLVVIVLLFGVIAGNIRGIVIPTLVTALIPVERHDRANGLNGMVGGIGFMVTSVISGFLVGRSGMYEVLLGAMIMSVAILLHLLTITIPEKIIIHLADAPKKVDILGTLKVVHGIPGMLALILFTTFNNFLGGVFMSLMDAYGLSLVSVETWGLMWGFLSIAFIIGGLVIAKWGLGKNPLHSMFMANFVIWGICSFFTIYPSIYLLVGGMFVYLSVVPYIEASEQTVIQKLVPQERQGRVFGFAQSVEQAASPITAFAIGPITQFIFIPYMTTGGGVDSIGGWFGTGPDRAIALVFTLAGIIGLIATIIARYSKHYHLLSREYAKESPAS